MTAAHQLADWRNQSHSSRQQAAPTTFARPWLRQAPQPRLHGLLLRRLLRLFLLQQVHEAKPLHSIHVGPQLVVHHAKAANASKTLLHQRSTARRWGGRLHSDETRSKGFAHLVLVALGASGVQGWRVARVWCQMGGNEGDGNLGGLGGGLGPKGRPK